MITKEKRIAFLMLPATMIEKFVARFLIVTVGMAAAIIVAASLAEITRYLVLPLFNLPEAFHQSVLYHLLSMAAIDGEQVFRGSGSALNMSYQNWLGELCGWAFLVWSHSLYILGGVIGTRNLFQDIGYIDAYFYSVFGLVSTYHIMGRQ